MVGLSCVGGYYVYNYNTKNHASSMPPAEVTAVNAALTEAGEAQGLLSDGQIAVVNKVYKQLRGDTTVEFTVYQTSPATDLAAAAGYLEKNAKADETMARTGSGSAVLEKDSAGSVTAYTVTPDA